MPALTPIPETLRPGQELSASQRWMLYAVAGFIACAISMTWPLSVLLADKLSVTGGAQGWLFSLQGLGMLLSAGPAAALCDRWGKRRVMVSSLALLLAGWAGVALHLSYATVALAQVLTGVGTASLTAVSAYVAAHTPESAHAKAFARMLAVRGLGQVGGPLLIAATLHCGPVVLCLGLSGLALVPALGACFLRESKGGGGDSSHGFSVPRVPRAVLLPLLAMVLLYITPSSVSTYVPVHAQQALGASPQLFTSLFSVLGLTMVLAPGVLWLLERRLPEKTAALVSYAALATAATAVTLASNLPVLIAAYAGWALLWDVTYPYVKAHMSRQAAPEQQAQVHAAEQFATGALGLLVGTLSGWLYAAQGGLTLFSAAAALTFAGVIAMRRSQRGAIDGSR